MASSKTFAVCTAHFEISHGDKLLGGLFDSDSEDEADSASTFPSRALCQRDLPLFSELPTKQASSISSCSTCSHCSDGESSSDDTSDPESSPRFPSRVMCLSSLPLMDDDESSAYSSDSDCDESE